MQGYESALEMGQAALQRGDLGEAKTQFLCALQMPEDWQEARRCLVRIALIQKQPHDAEIHLRVLLEADPEDAEAMALHGLLLLHRGQSTEAIEVLEEARRLAPGLALVYVNLALAYRAMGRLDEALEAARQSVVLDPDHLPHHDALGQLWLEKGRRGEAIRVWTEALMRDPRRLGTYLHLGGVLQQVGKLEQAIKLYTQGVQVVAEPDVLRERLYEMFLASQQPAQALEQAQALQRTRGSHADALWVGRCLLMLGRFEQAEKAFLEALALEPERWEVHFHLGEVYQVMQQAEEAEDAYLSAIRREPRAWQAHNGLGQLLLHLQRHEEAMECLRQAQSLAPQRPEPLLNLALCHALQSEAKEAMELAQQVRTISAQGSATYEEAGRLIEALENAPSSGGMAPH